MTSIWNKRTKHCHGFIDKQIKDAITDFFDNEGNYADFDMSCANKIVDHLPHNLSCSSVNWSWFQYLFDSYYEKREKLIVCILISKLIKYDCYTGDYSEIVETFKWMNSGEIKPALFWLLSNSLLPFNLIVIQSDIRTSSNKNQKSISSFKTDSHNLFLSGLLRNFILSGNTSNFVAKEFYANFQASLNGKLITSPNDFNAGTFKHQYFFYKQNFSNSTVITLLKSFYLKLINDGYEILNWQDGIDRNMLQMNSFNSHYENGYLPIPLNPFDSIPESDRWLIIPNGAEKKSTKLNSFVYKPIDFSLVKDSQLKISLKHWFWNSNRSLSSRIDAANIIIKFINFIYDLRYKFNLRQVTSSEFP
ncbi:hypothetical protein, partial [Cohnella lubricantis]